MITQTAPQANPQTPAPSQWSVKLPQLQLAWDSSSLSILKECPRKYQLSIIKGYAARLENAHLTWGRVYHSSLELYDRLRAKGWDFESSEREALKHSLIATWDFDLNRPWNSDINTKTRETLARSVVWYLETFKDDPVETVILSNGNAAVEVSFRFDPQIATRTTGEHFLICGHLDKLGRFERRVYILDRKSTKNQLSEDFFLQFNPHTQMSTYDIGGSFIFREEPIEGIIIDAVQTGVGFSRYQRGFTHRTEDLRAEWLRTTEYWLLTAEYLARKYGEDDWPTNDSACFGCQFRRVCAENPKMRQQVLDTGFVKRDWNPLVSREV
jgi:PD-(D/E)XK nuclease superfamily